MDLAEAKKLSEQCLSLYTEFMRLGEFKPLIAPIADLLKADDLARKNGLSTLGREKLMAYFVYQTIQEHQQREKIEQNVVISFLGSRHGQQL